MILNVIEDFYNSIIFKDLNNVNIDEYKFLNNKEKKDLKFTFINEGTDFVKFLFSEKLTLKNIKLFWKGTFDELEIQISLDNFSWETIFKGSFFDEDLEFDNNFFYIKFIFKNHQPNLKIIKLEINCDYEYDIKSIISHNSKILIPFKIRERGTILDDFINTFLKMLERNKGNFIDCDFSNLQIGVFYDNVDYSTGGINSDSIDEKVIF